MASIITLNVGGTCMKTYKSTLEKLEYFKSYFERWNSKENSASEEKEMCIDYDPKLFNHLLNKLRNGIYKSRRI